MLSCREATSFCVNRSPTHMCPSRGCLLDIVNRVTPIHGSENHHISINVPALVDAFHLQHIQASVCLSTSMYLRRIGKSPFGTWSFCLGTTWFLQKLSLKEIVRLSIFLYSSVPTWNLLVSWMCIAMAPEFSSRHHRSFDACRCTCFHIYNLEVWHTQANANYH